MKGKTREGQRNKCHIDMGKDKGRTEKHYSYLREELKNITHICIGKTKVEQRNKSHIDVGKDKGRTGKHFLYSYRERQKELKNITPI